ncbi:MAG: hypothetical protein Q4D04_13750, partial [Clostridia bacterium]|nr:hypothetical protein [Clostridia bacterium]
ASRFGLASCFIAPGCASLIMAAVVRFTLDERPVVDSYSRRKKAGNIRAILRDKRLRRVMIPAIAHGMIKDNLNVWFARYFVNRFSIDLSAVAGYIFLIPLLALVGRMLYPALYRLLKDENLVSTLAFIVCAAAVIPVCLDDISPIGAIICLGLISAMVAVINTHMLSAFPGRFAHTGNISFVASVMDLLTYGGAGVGSLVFGALIQRCGYTGMFCAWGAASLLSTGFLMAEYQMSKREAHQDI